MNEKDSEYWAKASEWWKNAKRRAFTYKEKKLNRLSDYDLYIECFGVDYLEQGMRDVLPDGKRISERQLKLIKKELEARVNREEYEKEIKTGDGIFAFMLGLRDGLPFLTNAEVYALLTHSLKRLMELVDEGKKPRQLRDIVVDMVGEMREDWINHMDTVPRTVEHINQFTENYKVNSQNK